MKFYVELSLESDEINTEEEFKDFIADLLTGTHEPINVEDIYSVD